MGEPERVGGRTESSTLDVTSAPLADLQSRLIERGHRSSTIRRYLQAADHFRKWNEQEQDATITQENVDEFLFRHLPVCRCVKTGTRSAKTCRAALAHLDVVLKERRLDLCKDTYGPVDREIRAFGEYLKMTCGLSDSTCKQRSGYARELIVERFGDGPVRVRDLTARDLMQYASKRARSLSTGSMAVVASSIRSYLRFLQFQGRIGDTLMYAVPSMSTRVTAGTADLPRVLSEPQIRAILRSFDQNTASGSRDYAISLCMVELGLRASEVASLRLQDIDWRRGTLRVRAGKTTRDRLLPLPPKPGKAMAAYLHRGRPSSGAPQLFVRHTVPVGEAMPTELVRGAMRRAYGRAGLPVEWTGTHLLRHTAASRMHQRGVPLKSVADVLGHRSIDTTAIYTKVDLNALKTVALPWPEAI